MELAARRPHLSASVALASAAVIAAGPVTQHLPKLDVAHHLPQVSVTDINLTDAASPMMDLFAGVENELASLASGGAAAAAVPADALSPLTGNLIVQTWNDAANTIATNGPLLANQWLAHPFPVLQQIGDNLIGYANTYVSAYQKAGFGFAETFGPGGTAWAAIPVANAALAAGGPNAVTNALNDILIAWIQNPYLEIGSDLEGILRIPGNMFANVSNAYNWTVSAPGIADPNLLTDVAGDLTQKVPYLIAHGAGPSLNSALQAWNAGDPLTALTCFFNTPGAFVDTLLKGYSSHPGSRLFPYTNGILTLQSNGWIQQLITFSNQFSQGMATPGATTMQGLVNTLTNGWSPMINSFSTQLTAMLQSLPSLVSNLPSMLSNFGGALAGSIGLLISNLLKLL